MDVWGKWELSSEAENRLRQIQLEPGFENSSGLSEDWFWLLERGSSSSEHYKSKTNVGFEKSNFQFLPCIINETLSSGGIVSDEIFVGHPISSLNEVLMGVSAHLDDIKFCGLCKSIACWAGSILVDLALRVVVLPKLKQQSPAKGCIIYSIKELAVDKPVNICESVLIPLLTEEFQFTDRELLGDVFTVLPPAQKDSLILAFTSKDNFTELDWEVLHVLIKDLTPNSVQNVLECTQRFSNLFTHSLVFGRFLLDLCKILHCVSDISVLKKVTENHQTLLKMQALKYFEEETSA